MRPLSDVARLAALAANLVLIGGLVVWCGAVAGLVLSLPLLALLPGLLKGRLYSAQWGSLLLVFYVAGLLWEAFSIHSHYRIGVSLSAVAAIEFVSLNLFARLLGRERAARPVLAPSEE